MTDKTLLAIANELDGSEWTRETPQKIANLLSDAGFHVERSFGVPVKVEPAGLSDENADELRGLKVALAEAGGENAALQERIHDLEDLSEGVKVMCGNCGSTEFRYEESHPCERGMAENHGEDGLVFYSEFEWYDGDDDPGVVCTSCDTTADTREIEINWQ